MSAEGHGLLKMFLFARFHFSFVTFFSLILAFIPVSAAEVTGSISGKVTDVDTGESIAGITVDIFDQSGSWSRSATTDDNGRYFLADYFADGKYYLRILNAGDYLGMIYGSTSYCVDWCDIVEGEAIQVSSGDEITDINFALQKGGSISGVVTDEQNEKPVANAHVSVCGFNGFLHGSGRTDVNGRYHVGGLLTGDYFVRFSTEGSDYASELLGGEPSPSFNNCVQGDPVEVQLGKVTENVDHALQKGGTITGKIIDSGSSAPVVNVAATVYSWDGHQAGWALTDENGSYHVKGLPSGYYFVKGGGWSSTEYISQFLGGFECQGWSCPITINTPVHVVSGEITPNINIALKKGGVISGEINASETGAPLSGVYVQVFNGQGRYLSDGYSDSNGIYRVDGLQSGDVYIKASLRGGEYSSQVYGASACFECDVLEGAPTKVVEGEVTEGINFSMQLSSVSTGSISGKVIDATSGEPISGNGYEGLVSYSAIGVVAVHVDGSWGGQGDISLSGEYEIEGLGPGEYYVMTSFRAEYINELYEGVACPNFWCDKTMGTVVTVNKGQEVTGIDLSVQKGGEISGVVSAVDGKYLGDANVSAFDVNGKYIASDSIDSNGYYHITGLQEGEVFLYFRFVNYNGGQYTWAYPYSEKIYSRHECVGWSCDVTQGQAVSVSLGQLTSGIDFTLEKGGVITGKVTAADIYSPLGYVQVNIYDLGGQLLQSSSANSKGEYKISGLPTGQYYLKFFPVYRDHGGWPYLQIPLASNYMAKVYGDINCSGQCDVTEGRVVNVISGQVTADVNVVLDIGSAMTGKLSSVESDIGQPYREIILYDENGSWLGFSVWTDADGNYTVKGLSAGNYYLMVRDGDGYGGELYGGVSCDLDCQITDGISIEIEEGQTTKVVNVVLGQTEVSQSEEVSEGDQQPISQDQNQNNRDQATESGGGHIGLEALLLLFLIWWRYATQVRRCAHFKG